MLVLSSFEERLKLRRKGEMILCANIDAEKITEQELSFATWES